MVNRIVSVDDNFNLPESVRGALTSTGTRPVGQGELVVNVVDYGADPTGTTPSGAAINAAITAAGTTSSVLIPAGTYLVDETINISANQTIRGAGRHLTILKRAADMWAVVATTGAQLSMGQTTPDEGNLQASFNLTDLTIDGNASSATTGDGHGLALYAMSYYLHNVAVHDTPGMGIWAEGPHGDGHGVGFGIQARWDTIRVAETGDPTCAVHFNGPHDSIIDNLVVKNHVAPVESRTVAYGLLVGPIGYGLHLHDSHIWGINHDYATRWEGGVTATNCQFEGARYAHVWIMSNLCNIFGGKIYTPGGLDTAVGVRIGEAGPPATFVSNYSINTSFFDCRGGAVWYDRDGGGTVTAYGAVPSAQSAVSTGYVGQPNRALSHANIRIASAGTNPSIMQFPRGGVGALPAGSPTIDDAAADVSTTTALVNQIRAALVENGLIRITPGGTTPGTDTVIAAGPTAADARAAIGAAAEGEGGGGTELTSYMDQVASLSDYPAFVAAGTSQTAARDAIGAGTSNLQLGTGPTTAKRGDYTPTVADVPNLPASKITTGTLAAARIPALPYAPTTHSHDDRYYTETEVDTLIDAMPSIAMIYRIAGSGDWVDQDGIVITARPNAKRVMAFGGNTQPAWLIEGDIWVENRA